MAQQHRAVEGDAHGAPAHGRVFALVNFPIGQAFVTAQIQGPEYHRPARRFIENAFVQFRLTVHIGKIVLKTD